MNEQGAYYVFDCRKLAKRVAYLRSLLGEGISLAYAIKANPFVVKGLLPHVERLEICSPGESHICDKVGVPPEKTVISGVYKTPEFIEDLVAKTEGRIYTVESLTQFSLLRRLSEQYGKTLPVLLRLTNDSQFGINEEDILEIVKHRAEYPGLDILGIQYFSGTQKTSLKKLKREIDRLDNLLGKLREGFGFEARELEYGPGFPVAYFGEALEEEALITGFADLLSEMRCKPRLTLELGRSIAACCGQFYTHVVDKKRNSGQNYLLVDGGMHQLIYFGQFMGMKIPALTVVGKENTPAEDSFTICGSLCSMNDILVKQAPLPPVEIGDTLCFANTGAYCMTEGMALFLSRDLPAVYVIDEAGQLLCARENTQTYPLNTL